MQVFKLGMAIQLDTVARLAVLQPLDCLVK